MDEVSGGRDVALASGMASGDLAGDYFLASRFHNIYS